MLTYGHISRLAFCHTLPHTRHVFVVRMDAWTMLGNKREYMAR
jgi:hypothetical protein